MNLRHLFFIGGIILTLATQANISFVRVELFRPFALKTIVIKPHQGRYQFTTEKGKIYKVKKNQSLYFSASNNYINVWDTQGHIGTFRKINFRGLTTENSFTIEPASPALKTRTYEGDIEVTVHKSKLNIFNYVTTEQYLAGVIEAEAGPNAPFEFYKSQAIISRTYLLEIILREGPFTYSLGDDVNHQVYKGMCRVNPEIKQAVNQTSGLVIVDTAMQLITAAFHSNSGGYTANSEDVWLSSKHYLRATPDPFSLNQKNSQWEDTITKDFWISYLNKNGIKVSDSAMDHTFIYDQENRNKYILINDDTLLLRKIREDLGLRSTWFSIHQLGDSMIFKGKGYGHGVGLSQEGAMQMARQNYSFIDIIHYYYKNVKVVHYDLLVP